MAIDWDDFNRSLPGLVTAAGKKTDDQLAGHVSQLTKLDADEIKQLYPDPADAQKLAELMQIVKSATAQNDKINQLVANSEKFAGIILPLLQKIAV